MPTEIRRKLGIKEGTRLKVDAEGDKVIVTEVPSIFDLAGSSKLTKEETFKLLDKMRAEDRCSTTRNSAGDAGCCKPIWLKFDEVG